MHNWPLTKAALIYALTLAWLSSPAILGDPFDKVEHRYWLWGDYVYVLQDPLDKPLSIHEVSSMLDELWFRGWSPVQGGRTVIEVRDDK